MCFNECASKAPSCKSIVQLIHAHLSHRVCTDTSLEKKTKIHCNSLIFSFTNWLIPHTTSPPVSFEENIAQSNAHLSAVRLQLGVHMLLWQYCIPTNKTEERDIFVSLSFCSFYLAGLLFLSAFHYLIPNAGLSQRSNAPSLTQTQQRPVFLGNVYNNEILSR